ncbi:MAG: HEAT repeat domain-containing protein [Scytonema sp. RU_4_4]|nr:HEAT repeat domain-containing protein [Scytonema sp. RU_4_4]
MDKRFSNLFGFTEEEAIALLDTPLDQLAEDDSRYVAASELVNFATENSINALMRAVQNTDPSLDNRIVRRKSVESLGKLQAKQALSVIRTCLADEDCYLVENTVWAIGEIGTQDSDILEEIAQLFDKPEQTYRVIIHTLAKLDYQPALERIRKFVDSSDKPTASAAISAVCRFTGDYTTIDKVTALLQHPNVYARRLCIQDLVDARYYDAIPQIAQCPVSLVFRLRGIRLLAEAGIPTGAITFTDIQPSLEQVIFDHPKSLSLVHAYDETPTIEFLVRELYDTDFGRCYLATQTLLEAYPESAGEALMATYTAHAHNDYGAHYHVMKLLGWLKYAPGYDLLVEALHNREPQFQKSRAGAAIALGEFGDTSAIPLLKAVLESKIWDLKYAALMALEKLGDTSAHAIAINDNNWLIRAKATHTPAS